MSAVDQLTLQNRLDELVAKFDVPGASVGVLTPDGVTLAASGVLNRETGVEATTDSLFQIGSITKIYVTAMVMRLVERGELDLDVPVRTYLPEFRVSDEDATSTVTLQHLLSHTSGIDGDHFVDFGRGDDALEKYVASCADLGQQFAPSASHSYCNAAFSIIGRLMEVVTGRVWDDLLREEVLDPLGLDRTHTLPEEVIRHRAACGHIGKPGALTLSPQWSMPRSTGPAGIINASAEDLLTFAQAFLNHGVVGDTAWLRPGTTASMLEPQVEVPNPYTLGAQWATGWILYNSVEGRVLYGHDGATLGQGAALRCVPDRGVAVVVLANGGGMVDLHQALLRDLLAETADLELPEPLSPVEGASGGDRSANVGTYVRDALTLRFDESGATGLTATLTVTHALASFVAAEPVVVELLLVSDDVYVGQMPGAEAWTSYVFYSLPDGSRYVHTGGRATARVKD